MAGLNLSSIALANMGNQVAQVPGEMAGLQMKQAQAQREQALAQEEQQKAQGGLAMNQALGQAMQGQQPSNDPLQAYDQQIQATLQAAQQLPAQFGDRKQALLADAQKLRGEKTQLALSRAAQASRLGNYAALKDLAPHFGIQGVDSGEYDPDSKMVNLMDKDGNVIGGIPKETLDELDLTSQQRAVMAWQKYRADTGLEGRRVAAEGGVERAQIAGEYGLAKANVSGEWGVRRAEVTGQYNAKREAAHNAAMNSGSVGVPDEIQKGATGPDAVNALFSHNPAYARKVMGVVEGRMSPPSTFAQKTPYWEGFMDNVFAVDQGWNEQRAQVRKAFTTGKDGTNIGNLNTATRHLDAYLMAADAMHNGEFKPGNAVYNTVKEMLGQSPPVTFEALKSAVAGEQANALKGVATDIEIKNLSSTLSRANSPEQFQDSGKALMRIMYQKLQTYQERYEDQLKTYQMNGDQSWSPILPSAKNVFDKYGITEPPGQPQTPKPNVPHGAKKVISLDEYLKQ